MNLSICDCHHASCCLIKKVLFNIGFDLTRQELVQHILALYRDLANTHGFFLDWNFDKNRIPPWHYNWHYNYLIALGFDPPLTHNCISVQIKLQNDW
jgi:hypothetical protein